MKFIIGAAGTAGLGIAQYLEKYHHDVILIDIDPDVIGPISQSYDIQALKGSITNPAILENIDAKNADVFLAVTPFDEVNIMACEMAHRLFHIPLKMARLKNANLLNYPAFTQNTNIDVFLLPEEEIARSISQTLKVPGASKVFPIGNGQAYVVSIKCTPDTPTVNTPLFHISTLFPQARCGFLALIRDRRPMLADPHETLLAGDELYFIVPQDAIIPTMQALSHHFSTYKNLIERVLIVGAGKIGLTVARMIEKEYPHIHLKVIDKNRHKAEYAEGLLKSDVLWGDGLNRDILEEANIAHTDITFAFTSADTINMLVALFAKNCGTLRTGILSTASHLRGVVNSLDIDFVIDPRPLILSNILTHLKGPHIRSVYPLDFGEIIEVEIHEQSNLHGLHIRDINIPGQARVVALIREEAVIFPEADEALLPEDRMVLIAFSNVIPEIQDLLTERKQYF